MGAPPAGSTEPAPPPLRPRARPRPASLLPPRPRSLQSPLTGCSLHSATSPPKQSRPSLVTSYVRLEPVSLTVIGAHARKGEPILPRPPALPPPPSCSGVPSSDALPFPRAGTPFGTRLLRNDRRPEVLFLSSQVLGRSPPTPCIVQLPSAEFVLTRHRAELISPKNNSEISVNLILLTETKQSKMTTTTDVRKVNLPLVALGNLRSLTAEPTGALTALCGRPRSRSCHPEDHGGFFLSPGASLGPEHTKPCPGCFLLYVQTNDQV